MNRERENRTPDEPVQTCVISQEETRDEKPCEGEKHTDRLKGSWYARGAWKTMLLMLIDEVNPGLVESVCEYPFSTGVCFGMAGVFLKKVLFKVYPFVAATVIIFLLACVSLVNG